MTQTPTDALRLVPTAIDKLEAVYDWLREPDYGDTFNKNDLVEWLNRRPSALLMTTIGELRRSERAPAPESPLPGGGWRTDFENAPKDGRWIVTIDKWRNAETMRWSNEVSRLFPEHGERGWVAKGGYSPNTRPELSVAWAELPAAPTGEPK